MFSLFQVGQCLHESPGLVLRFEICCHTLSLFNRLYNMQVLLYHIVSARHVLSKELSLLLILKVYFELKALCALIDVYRVELLIS